MYMQPRIPMYYVDVVFQFISVQEVSMEVGVKLLFKDVQVVFYFLITVRLMIWLVSHTQ